MSSCNVLIVTEIGNDPHAERVLKLLSDSGSSVFVLDPPELLNGSCELEYGHSGDRLHVRISGTTLDLASIRAVYVRRPRKLDTVPNIDPIYDGVAIAEWNALLASFWQVISERAMWISHPSNIRAAESKSRQIQLAKRFGLRVPETLITNDFDAAQAFLRNHVGAVVKKLYSPILLREDSVDFFVTKRVSDVAAFTRQELQLCPVIFQEEIGKSFDARIVIVGQRAFAVGIDSQELPETSTDYRAALADGIMRLRHFEYVPPTNVIEACKKMLLALGLRFGAFDFVVTSLGEHWFLELNPNGQWLWLQEKTGVKIAEELSQLLMMSSVNEAQ